MNLHLLSGDSGGPLYRYINADNEAKAVAVSSCGDPNYEWLAGVWATPDGWGLTVSTSD